jgi:hypothetical protein
MKEKKEKSISVELRDEEETVVTAKDLKEKMERLEAYIEKARRREEKYRTELKEELSPVKQRKMLEKGKEYYDLTKEIEEHV